MRPIDKILQEIQELEKQRKHLKVENRFRQFLTKDYKHKKKVN